MDHSRTPTQNTATGSRPIQRPGTSPAWPLGRWQCCGAAHVMAGPDDGRSGAGKRQLRPRVQARRCPGLPGEGDRQTGRRTAEHPAQDGRGRADDDDRIVCRARGHGGRSWSAPQPGRSPDRPAGPAGGDRGEPGRGKAIRPKAGLHRSHCRRGPGRGGSARRELGARYAAIIRLWENAWEEFIPFLDYNFLDYDVEIRQVICSTNAIESLNARYRRAVKARGHFPTRARHLESLYLVTRSLTPPGPAGPGGPCDETRTERIRHHLRRPVPGRRDLLTQPARKHRSWDRPERTRG